MKKNLQAVKLFILVLAVIIICIILVGVLIFCKNIAFDMNKCESDILPLVKDICMAKGYDIEDELVESDNATTDYIGHIKSASGYDIQISISQTSNANGWMSISLWNNSKKGGNILSEFEEDYDLIIELLNSVSEETVDKSTFDLFFANKGNVVKMNEIDDVSQMFYIIKKEQEFGCLFFSYYIWAIPNNELNGYSERYGLEEVFEINCQM